MKQAEHINSGFLFISKVTKIYMKKTPIANLRGQFALATII